MKRFLGSTVALLLMLFLSTSLAAEGALFREGGTVGSSITTEKVGLNDFSDLVEQIAAAVVNISAEGDGDPDETVDLPFPFFRGEPNQPTRSLGSGFVIHRDGYIVTNNHVLGSSSSEVRVRFQEEREEYTAEVIGRDDKTDLALIKIEARRELPTLAFGDSDQLRVGEWVLAIGNQFQLGQTVTAGIVSAKSRRVSTPASGPYDQFIQTDASINPGSSGGPLVNSRGEVVGINTAIFSPGRQQFGSGSGFNIGIGFSIPVNLAKGILTQLHQTGKVTRGLLGVVIQSITADMKEAMNLESAKGALVADVVAESAAARAGFKIEDIIYFFDGREVKDHEDLPLMVANTPVGKVVEVRVNRGGEEIVLHPRISELAESGPSVFEADSTAVEGDSLGLVVERLPAELAARLGVSVDSGVIVKEIEPDSVAEKGGILKGDILHQLNREQILGLESYQSLRDKLPQDRAFLVLVRRPEGTRFLTLRLQ